MSPKTVQKVREHAALFALAEVAPDGIRSIWGKEVNVQLGPAIGLLLAVAVAIWASLRLSNRIASQVRRVTDLSVKVDRIYDMVAELARRRENS